MNGSKVKVDEILKFMNDAKFSAEKTGEFCCHYHLECGIWNVGGKKSEAYIWNLLFLSPIGAGGKHGKSKLIP